MSDRGARRTRRTGMLGAAVLALVLSVGSMAFACTKPEGTTFFTDGKTSKTVARGQRISAYATGAHLDVQYKLVIGSVGPHPTHSCMLTDYVVNDTVVMPTTDKFIGSFSGPAGDANLVKSTYQVCFKDYLRAEWATSAATITII